jgi:peptidoglycan/xylan/chitin deacetylase (PgdA/CDA1 family)
VNLRADRFLTLRLFAPIGRVLTRADRQRLPILMYHGISNDVETQRSAYFRTRTAPATFERQMNWLRDQGYCGVGLSEGLAALCPQPTTDAHIRRVVITFDDGLRDFATAAFPILQAVGFGATVFVSTSYVGGRFMTGQPCLSAREIKDLSAAGIEFGSHTATHPQLASLSAPEIEQELVTSRNALEAIVKRQVTTFSYPYRFPAQDRAFVEVMVAMLDRAGYRAGVTTTIGRASSRQQPLLLSRLPINDCDDESLFAAKVEGGYDWLRLGQHLYKALRGGPKRSALAKA